MIRKDEKTAVIEANRTHPTDTGSPEVQIAILTARINELTVSKEIKDFILKQSEEERMKRKTLNMQHLDGNPAMSQMAETDSCR